MGMYYDEAGQCWRLDFVARVDGLKSPKHFKDTIHGPKRATQAEAMQRWLELHQAAKNPASSLKFGDDCDRYIRDNPNLKQGIRSIIEHLKSGLGDVKRSQFKTEFKNWIDLQSKRNVMKWKRVDGELKLCDTGKPLSPATIQSYKRYAKLIARANGYGDAFEGIKIGRRVVRRRPIEPFEMLQLEAVIQEFFPWFYPAFDFARTNPIRPEDQFSLTVEEHFKNNKIKYPPQKTFPKTGLMAHPIIWEHQKQRFENLVSGYFFSRPDGSEMHTNQYYDYIWGKILKKANLKNIQFYDLRHHAVAWMRSQGIEDWRIVKAAGWSSMAMLYDYDPDNSMLIDEYDKGLNNVAKCSPFCSAEETKPLKTLNDIDETY